jgi:hypothetical protein
MICATTHTKCDAVYAFSFLSSLPPWRPWRLGVHFVFLPLSSAGYERQAAENARKDENELAESPCSKRRSRSVVGFLLLFTRYPLLFRADVAAYYGTHFDAASQLTLGKRFADAMLELLNR